MYKQIVKKTNILCLVLVGINIAAYVININLNVEIGVLIEIFMADSGDSPYLSMSILSSFLSSIALIITLKFTGSLLISFLKAESENKLMYLAASDVLQSGNTQNEYTGSLYEDILAFSQAFLEKYYDNFIILLSSACSVTIAMAVIIRISLPCVIVYTIFILAANITQSLIGNMVKKGVNARQEALEEMTTYFTNVHHNIESVKIYGIINYVKEKFKGLTANWLDKYHRTLFEQLSFRAISSVFSIFATVFSIGIIAVFTLNGDIKLAEFITVSLIIIPVDELVQNMSQSIIEIKINNTIIKRNPLFNGGK